MSGDGARRPSRGQWERSEIAAALTPPQLHAARHVVARVRSEIDVRLVQASLFGSRARGDSRPDSDIDILLVFQHLPPDREPQATNAEMIADEEARRLGIPVTVWSVALIDTEQGQRTPMLVDALADSIPIWRAGPRLATPEFTPHDAVACVEALLRRTEENSHHVAAHLRSGDAEAAARLIRDDVIRLCTGHLLLVGATRPRRAAAVAAFRERFSVPVEIERTLRWAERSYGPDGTDEEAAVPPPDHGVAALCTTVTSLGRSAARARAALAARTRDRGGDGEVSTGTFLAPRQGFPTPAPHQNRSRLRS